MRREVGCEVERTCKVWGRVWVGLFSSQAHRVVVEGDGADVVKGEELEDVLKVYGFAAIGGFLEEREEAVSDLLVDCREDEVAEGFGVEFEACCISLHL